MTVKAEYAEEVNPAQSKHGRLYLVGTPIGNLEDITLRAIRILKEVDLIACEDTRRTLKLLNHFEVQTPTISYHEHNELTRAPELVIQMEQGMDIALVTDAGMPVISDPGFRLVHLAIRHNIPIVPVPGASAFIAALAAAGLPVENFRFLGFLPSRKGARRRAIEELKRDNKTLIFYESPHRLVDMLRDMLGILGNRPVVLAREVTKVHEEFIRGSVEEVLDRLGNRPVKGELTVLVEGYQQGVDTAAKGRPIKEALDQIMSEKKVDERTALKLVARARGISRSEAYRQLQMEKMSMVTSDK